MKLMGGAPAPRVDGPATAILYDAADARVVAFGLGPGQVVPPHRSASTVVLQVVAGSGLFHGEADAVRLSAPQAVVFAPGETHSIEAGPEGVEFYAFIAPGPA